MSDYFLTLEKDPLVRLLRDNLPVKPQKNPGEKKYRCAAVILPLIKRNNKWHVIFTKRTETVDHHRGEFSFPGGIVEKSDRTERDAALRETEEEMGIKSKDIMILGSLSSEITAVSYFLIYPFVGVINPDAVFKINKDEIERVIEVPLDVLISMKNVREETFEHSGNKFKVYFYNYRGDVIWGATGRILKQFLDLIRNKI
jgi:8-oxo-dGTP pyrophosphatase MutT (NUDIX family)